MFRDIPTGKTALSMGISRGCLVAPQQAAYTEMNVDAHQR